MTVNQSTFLNMESPSLERFLSGRPMVGYVLVRLAIVAEYNGAVSVFFNPAIDYCIRIQHAFLKIFT